MTKRICWKKGMRLSDSILRTSDICALEYTNKALMLASAGRFGLIPNIKPFSLQIDINQNRIEIISLDCLGITKDGSLIDVENYGNYSGRIGNDVYLPDDEANQEYLLLISVRADQWKETNDGFEEPVYEFSLSKVDSAIDARSLPIGLLKKGDYGWQSDDVNFVPPCLYVSSHIFLEKELIRFKDGLIKINDILLSRLQSGTFTLNRIFLPEVRKSYINLICNKEVLTPFDLLAEIKKVLNAFLVSMLTDDYYEISTEIAESLNRYVMGAFSYHEIYKRIKEGLDYCFVIAEILEKGESKEEPSVSAPNAPTISNDQMKIRCTKNRVTIMITNNEPGAKVFYTIDGSEPTINSQTGLQVPLTNNFHDNRKMEPDNMIIVKVMAVLNGVCSTVNSYQITLCKNIAAWNGINI